MWVIVGGGLQSKAKGVCRQEDAGGDSIKIDSSIQPGSPIGPASDFGQAVLRYEQAHNRKAVTALSTKEDVVEISSLARLLSREDQAQGVRWALVEQIKAQISSGVYDQTDKVDHVLSSLLNDLDHLA